MNSNAKENPNVFHEQLEFIEEVAIPTATVRHWSTLLKTYAISSGALNPEL
jgi:hypothetical protein